MSISFSGNPADGIKWAELVSANRTPSEGIDNRIRGIQNPSVLRESPERWGERELEENLFNARAEFKVLASRVSMHLNREWRERLFRQLDSLLDPAEWDPDDIPPGMESFRTFIRMILTLQPEKRPGVGASGEGTLLAAWTSGRNRLTVECLPLDEVKWVLTRCRGDDVERAAGQAKLNRLSQVLEPYAPEIWFRNAE